MTEVGVLSSTFAGLVWLLMSVVQVVHMSDAGYPGFADCVSIIECSADLYIRVVTLR